MTTTTIDYTAMFKADETPTTIMATDTFQITARTIAKGLHVPLQDAQAMLIEEIHSHRHLLDEVTGGLTDAQKKAIQFAKRDVLTKHFKAEQARQAIETPAVDSKGSNLVDNMEALPDVGRYSEDELIRVLDVSEGLFNKQTQEFATNLLLHGKEWTKAEMGYSERVFNKRLKRILASFNNPNSYSRKKANKLVKSDYQLKHEANVQMAEQFIQMVDSSASNEWIINWLQQSIDNPYFDEAWDKVRYQGKLLREGFSTQAGRAEAYKFVNRIVKMIERG
ncbi:hypothetical protein EFA59_05925 [Weissella hellenica]|nr:hypothetical protein EFA59_05925 [Weissella hellenica]